MSNQQFSMVEDSINLRNSLGKHSNNEIRELVRKSNLSADFIIDALSAFRAAVRFFSLNSTNNKTDELIEDIIEYCSDSVTEIESLKDKLLQISKLAPKYGIALKEDGVKVDVLPILKALNGTVVFKPVFEERFDFNEIDIKDYKPKFIKQVACIVLELRNSDGVSFYVQFGTSEYEQFLNELIALQVELKTLENDRG